MPHNELTNLDTDVTQQRTWASFGFALWHYRTLNIALSHQLCRAPAKNVMIIYYRF